VRRRLAGASAVASSVVPRRCLVYGPVDGACFWRGAGRIVVFVPSLPFPTARHWSDWLQLLDRAERRFRRDCRVGDEAAAEREAREISAASCRRHL
jgi:hypothetical protein